MATLKVNTKKLASNIKKLDNHFRENNIFWTLVTKVLCGSREILKAILNDPVMNHITSIGDSRLSSLKMAKSIRPDIQTMYIRPPAIKYIKTVIQCADISLNSSFKTIKALSEEAKRQKKTHKVVIMIEMGELREGVLRDNFVDFYNKVFSLPNIEIIGLGTNLGCMYGIEPTYDKLIQLSLYKQLLEVKFDKPLGIVSGGSSITLPLISRKKIPKLVNHFRVGEAAFLGTSPLDNERFKNLYTDAFEFEANIIELEKKETIPDGIIGEGNIGEAPEIDGSENTEKSYRAILDFGVLDVDPATITPKEEGVEFFGTTSDMTVFDLGKKARHMHRVFKDGGKIVFSPNYMAVARLMNSKFISKEIVR